MADSRHEAGADRMLEFLNVMSDDDHDHPLIRNEDTLRRRAWIDRALAGVRGRLKPDELGEASLPAEAPAPLAPPAALDPAAPPVEPPGRPRLYVVRSADSRR